MRAWILVVLPAIAGCNAILGIGGDFHVATDGASVDTATITDDAMPDAISCFGALAPVCGLPPNGAVAITANLDTDSDPRCVATVATRCVIAGTAVTLQNSVRVSGTRPLVLVAMAGDITIGGTLDASSTRNGQRGAAANDATCPPNNGNASNNGGSGGAGGSFGGSGGAGGMGGTGAVGAIAGPTVVVATLRGGCGGGKGALGEQSGMIAAGGDSGGALDLIATGSIEITGAIFASGAGGRQNTANSGAGGGGGSGGLIVLEAPTIQSVGTVAANGGGGGGGGDLGNGQDGNDGTTTSFNSTAGGGQNEGGAHGGRGGDGAAIGKPAQGGNKPSGSGGGGGGGGGLGYVWVHGTIASGADKMSPAPVLH